jgi:hypothetical protein
VAVIDKLEIRVQHQAPFRREFAEFYRQLAWEQPKLLKSSRYYGTVVDLRDFGHQLILHNSARLSKSGDNKIELMETGGMSYARMQYEIEQIYDINPQKLSVMRVDSAADIPNVPLSWFMTHSWAQFKRWVADIGQIENNTEYSEMGMKALQTLYYGKRPNVIRIYDKTAERLYRLKKQQRLVSPDAELLTFEEVYGYSPNLWVTRVERQFAGGRVPTPLSTFQNLRAAADFNPFQNLRLINGGDVEPQPDNYKLNTYALGMLVRQRANEWGLHRTRCWLNERSPGNAARILSRVSDFLPGFLILQKPRPEVVLKDLARLLCTVFGAVRVHSGRILQWTLQ